MTERAVEVLVCRPLWLLAAAGCALGTAGHFLTRPWLLLP